MREVDLAYIAGLVDGEGYVGIKKHKFYPKHCPSPYYQERIQIRMVREEGMKLLKETLGGSYYRQKNDLPSRKPLFLYCASDLSAAKILRAILPYLLIKKEVAKVVLQLRENKEKFQTLRIKKRMRLGSPKGYRMDSAILEEREALYLRCKELNRKGPP